jgi:hypothetical protein
VRHQCNIVALKVLWAEEVVLFILVAKDLHLLVVQLEPERLFVVDRFGCISSWPVPTLEKDIP